MKTNVGILAAVISVLVLVFATDSLAQRGMQWKGSGGWGMGTQYGRMYDPKTIARKDKIAVKGSRVTFQGKPAILAAEVKEGDETLELRNENGFPVWAGWRRR